MTLKAGRVANIADPEQTAHQSSLIWVCNVCSDIFVHIFRVNTVIKGLPCQDFFTIYFNLVYYIRSKKCFDE